MIELRYNTPQGIDLRLPNSSIYERSANMKFLLILSLIANFLFASVDINTATVEQLVTLKGIGHKKAKRIVAYRKKHGCFKTLKDFRKVKGIKKKTIKKNRGNIVINECKTK